jgi:hypothetical protein
MVKVVGYIKRTKKKMEESGRKWKKMDENRRENRRTED